MLGGFCGARLDLVPVGQISTPTDQFALPSKDSCSRAKDGQVLEGAGCWRTQQAQLYTVYRTYRTETKTYRNGVISRGRLGDRLACFINVWKPIL